MIWYMNGMKHSEKHRFGASGESHGETGYSVFRLSLKLDILQKV